MKTRVALALGISLLATGAWATPDVLRAFTRHYNLGENSQFAMASCANCHTQPPTHNAFGKLVKQHLDQAGDFTPAFWEAIDKASAPDGGSYGDMIKADRSPSLASGESAPTGPRSPIPGHSFHPAVIHFPIALTLFAAFAELVNLIKGTKSEGRDTVVRWCLYGALASMLVVLPTGWVAHLRANFPLVGVTDTHFKLALASLVFIGLSAALSRRGGLGFRIALLLAVMAVGATGHFGSLMVFGE